MRDGIYEITFYQHSDKKADLGVGIVTIKDGAMNGGDGGYIYRGKLSFDEGKATGRIHVSKWSLAFPSVFAGLDDYYLDYLGDVGDGDSIDGWGTVVGQASLTLYISAHRVGDAA